MKKALRKTEERCWYFVGGVRNSGCHDRLSGDVSGLSGNVSGLRGDVSGLYGNVDDCELSDDERNAGVSARDLCES